ncbi:hypothetical protein DL98DRAFT_618942 [Cadophora sp. DSE1049]|nr:hypothetical protein DL98DRAFT_618942 [Cadophora sp. DSE1049]
MTNSLSAGNTLTIAINNKYQRREGHSLTYANDVGCVSIRSANTSASSRSVQEIQESTVSRSISDKSLVERWNARQTSEMSRAVRSKGVSSPTLRQPKLTSQNMEKRPADDTAGNSWTSIENIGSRERLDGRSILGVSVSNSCRSAEPVVQSSVFDADASSWRSLAQPLDTKSTWLGSSEETRPQVVQRLPINTNYRGHTTSRYFMAQVPGLSDELNCAVWLEDLPVGTTTEWLLSKVHTGAIFASHISQPTTTKPLCAAKLVFMNHTGAAKLLEYLKTPEGKQEFGGSVIAKWNVHGHVEYKKPESRVLRIIGAAPFMTLDFWKEFLKYMENFKYQISHTLQYYSPDGRLAVEIGFGRLDSQASFVKKSIMKDICCGELADVEWAPDPCGS